MSFIRKFSGRDLGFAVVTGLIAGGIGWQSLNYLAVPEYHGLSWAALVVIVPVLWILGVLLGYFLGQWLPFFDQFGKFAAIGFTNFSVSLGMLNLLLYYTGYASGYGYAVINSVAFIVATLSSYFWNKYWAFNAGSSRGGGIEFGKFFIVTIAAFLVNIGVASIVVNLIHPVLGLTAHQWANVGAIVGSAAGLVFSFAGFKLTVFR